MNPAGETASRLGLVARYPCSLVVVDELIAAITDINLLAHQHPDAVVDSDFGDDCGYESRLRKSEQGDKWSFCLTAGKIGPRMMRDDEHTSTPKPHPGFQGEAGAC